MSDMVDWVTATGSYSGKHLDISGGSIMVVGPDGSVEWQKRRGLSITGSHDSKLQIRSEGPRMWISGNPAKFLQGHNVFGSPDPNLLMGRLVADLQGRDLVDFSDHDLHMWHEGQYTMSRLDVTRSFDLVTDDRVTMLLQAVSVIAHSSRQYGDDHPSVGSKGNSAPTFYLGQHSERVTLKMYNKYQELQAHNHKLAETLPEAIKHLLMGFAYAKLRVEVTARGKLLKTYNKVHGYDWEPRNIGWLLDDRIGGLELSDTMKLADPVAEELPPKLRLVYHAWRAGVDMRALYSKTAFYRYRSQLLPYGVDIARTNPREVVAETQYLLGAPMKSFLQGPGVEPPQWAHGTSYLVA